MIMMMLYEMKGATIMTCLWLLLSVLIGIANGQVVVNEVSDVGGPVVSSNPCGSAEWIELQNRGLTAVDIASYTLYDSGGSMIATKATFPSPTLLGPSALLILCRNAESSFMFGISPTDTITLADSTGTVISTTGAMQSLGSSIVSFQLKDDGVTYAYAPATPNAVNVFPPPDVVVNEVASTGVPNICATDDYIELLNRSPSISDVSGWFLRDDSNATLTIPTNTTIAPNGYVLFCRSQFLFGIGNSDTITLYNPSNAVVSSSGKLLGAGTSTSTFSRRPNGNFSNTKPSPNAENIFFSPLFGTIFVNEVAPTAVSGVCNGADYVELFNKNSTASFNLSGFLLYDSAGPASTNAYRFPDTTALLAPNEARLLCGDATFAFGINGLDTITVIDANGELVSTTGTMLDLDSAISTFQLSSDQSVYLYGTPSPGAANTVAAIPKVVINEVADKAVVAGCNGMDYIELYNEGTSTADVSNFRLRDDANATFIIPNNTSIPAFGYKLFCQSDFLFGIGGNDTVTLYTTADVAVATTGALGSLGSTTLTYSRRPNGAYAYTKPSPNAVNVFFSPLADIIFVNEVANTAVLGICNAQDYIEIINTGATPVNLSGFLLHDDNGPNGAEPFLFPSNFSLLSAGEVRLLCGDSPGNFQFGIGGDDTITLLDSSRDLVSTTGALTGGGSATLTYQRTAINTYQYAPPTPGAANFVTAGGNPVLNEIAPSGTSFTNVCGGGPFIEILNDAFAALDLAGYVLNVGTGNYTFPAGTNIASGAFSVFCQSTTFSLTINANATITIANSTGFVVSSSGKIGGNNARPSAIDLTWARVVDLINPSAPFTPFYQYSINPTPGQANIFSFDPITLPRQPCGNQARPLAPIDDYVFKELLKPDLGRNPEFSGGTFDPRTCNNLVVGDEGNLNEVSIMNSTATLIRTIPVFGGSRDTEGVCFWYNYSTGESKVVITDERDRSVAVCDIPTMNQVVPLFRDSSNCRILTLAQNQRNRTSTDANEGFEGVVCDPMNGKLYVIQEKNPMLMWSVDFNSGVYTEMIDVQSLSSWTSRVVDLAGITYDNFTQSLYVLSQESKSIVQSTLNGTILGNALSVSMMNAPEGLSFDPVTGDLIVYGEPNEIARFSKGPVVASFSFVLQLQSVPGPLDNTTTAIFLESCAEFFEQQIPEATSVNCTLSDRRRLQSRALQTNVNVPVDVTAIFEPTYDATGFAAEILQTIEANSTGFNKLLQENSEPGNTYFQSVSVEGIAPTKAPTKTPTKAPSSTAFPTKNPTKAPTKAPTTDFPSTSPSFRPVKEPVKAPVTVPVPVTAPTAPMTPPVTTPTSPVTPPVTAPTVPITPPMTTPTAPVTPPLTAPTAPVTPPMTAPTVPITPPMTAPVKIPSAPVKVPTKAPVKLPTANTTAPVVVPTDAPAREPCGLLNLSIFCPFTQCGLFGRIIGLCN